MDAEDLVDELVWKVLLKIKNKELLTEIGLPINFGYPTQEEEQVLAWLEKEKFINFLNSYAKSIISTRGVPPEDIKLRTVQPQFDEIYQEYNDYFYPPNPQKIKTSEMKQRVNEVVITKSLKGKEKLFLQILSNMEPVSIKKIKEAVDTKHCKELKSAVQKKLKNTGLNIKTIKATELGKDSYYQLQFLTK